MTAPQPSFGGADVAHVIALAVSGDWEGVAQAVADIAHADGLRGLFAFSCGVCMAVVKLAELEPGEDEFVGIETSGSGPEDPAALWSARMVTAIANRDTEQALALFMAERGRASAPEDPKELVAGIVALLGVAAGVVRQAGSPP